MNRHAASGTLSERIAGAGSGNAEWLQRTKSNNSLNPTLASESFIIKLADFCYLVCGALASVGLIRALDGNILKISL